MRFLLSLLLSVPSTAFAVVSMAGIYQSSTTGSYVVISQNGASFVAVSMASLPASNVFVALNNGQKFAPSSLGFWGYTVGVIDENGFATENGFDSLGMCNTQSISTLSNGILISKLTAISSTSRAAAQGINCASLIPVGTTLNLLKIW